MNYTNGRDGGQITRKDTVFAAINTLALLDKRTIAKKLHIETPKDLEREITGLASKYNEYIENGRTKDGSAGPLLLECDVCFKGTPEDDLREVNESGNDSWVCSHCFELILAESRESEQHESV